MSNANQTWWERGKEGEHLAAGEGLFEDGFAVRVNGMELEHGLGDIKTQTRHWLHDNSPDRTYRREGGVHRAHPAQGAVKIAGEMKMAQKKLRHFLRRSERGKRFFYSFNVELTGPSRLAGEGSSDRRERG